MTKKKVKYDFGNPDHKLPSCTDTEAWEDYHEQWKEYFKEQLAISDALPEGLHVGKIFAIGVADGSAYYQIGKVFNTRVRLVWRWDLSPDHYSDHYFRKGGSFPREEVERYIIMADGYKKIFGKNGMS